MLSDRSKYLVGIEQGQEGIVATIIANKSKDSIVVSCWVNWDC